MAEMSVEPLKHCWELEDREIRRHEQRRGRRHAFEHLDPRRTALVVIDLVPFFVAHSGYVRGIMEPIGRQVVRQVLEILLLMGGDAEPHDRRSAASQGPEPQTSRTKRACGDRSAGGRRGRSDKSESFLAPNAAARPCRPPSVGWRVSPCRHWRQRRRLGRKEASCAGIWLSPTARSAEPT